MNAQHIIFSLIALTTSPCWSASNGDRLIANRGIYDKNDAWQTHDHNNAQRAAIDFFNKTSINADTSFNQRSINDAKKIAPLLSAPTLINYDNTHSTNSDITHSANNLNKPINNNDTLNRAFKNSKKSITIEQLPPEIITAIAEFLNPQSLLHIIQVSKQLKDIGIRILTIYSNQLLQQHNNNPDIALLAAATNNMPFAISYLIHHKADVNARDENGRSPLMWAADKNNQAIVTQLLKAKADVMASDRLGYTALMVAQDHNYEAIAKTLEGIIITLENQKKCVTRKYSVLGFIGTIACTLAFVFIGYWLCSTNPSACRSLNHTINNPLYNNTG